MRENNPHPAHRAYPLSPPLNRPDIRTPRDRARITRERREPGHAFKPDEPTSGWLHRKLRPGMRAGPRYEHLQSLAPGGRKDRCLRRNLNPKIPAAAAISGTMVNFYHRLRKTGSRSRTASIRLTGG